MLVARVCEFLAAREIPHALIGAAALAAAGISRSTFDIDLLTTDAAVLRDTTWAPLRAEGVSVDVRRGDHDGAFISPPPTPPPARVSRTAHRPCA